MDGLEDFILEAKAASYVGGSSPAPPSRTGAHDIGYRRARWRYLDSYFGGTDFLGQEVVWSGDTPVWAMNYHGRVLDPERISGSTAGAVIREALSALYRLDRFMDRSLGPFAHEVGPYRSIDSNAGSVAGFWGTERIVLKDRDVYRLDYHGGMVKP